MRRKSSFPSRPIMVQLICHRGLLLRCPRTLPRNVSQGNRKWMLSKSKKLEAVDNLVSRSADVPFPWRRKGNRKTGRLRIWIWRWCWCFLKGQRIVASDRGYFFPGLLSLPFLSAALLTSLNHRATCTITWRLPHVYQMHSLSSLHVYQCNVKYNL